MYVTASTSRSSHPPHAHTTPSDHHTDMAPRTLAITSTSTPPPPSPYRNAAAVLVISLVLLNACCGGIHVVAAAPAAAVADAAAAAAAVIAADQAAATVPVHVGVILDLETALGKKSLLSLEMALEDFYAAHPSFVTRVKLRVRDSNRDVVTAASAAVDIICNENVTVVIGPQNILQAEFITYLANKTKVPVISFSATRDAATQYHVPYFIRACVKDSFQAASIAAFVKDYGWKNVVIVYEDNDYGVGILPSITDELQDVEAHVIYRSAIPASSPNSLIDLELYKLMTMQTRVFIVHMLPARAACFFARASAAGMMTEGYVWIVTDNVGTSLDVLPEHTIETMQGVVSFRPYVAKSVRTTDFTARFVTQFIAKYHQYTDVRMARPTVYQYWAYDVACAVAIATEKLKRVRFSNLGFQTLEGEGKRLLDGLVPTPAGPKLLRSILEAEFDGLAGRFRLVDRHLQIPIYEVVNLIGEKARGIGFWSPGSGLLRLLNSSNCQSGAICSMSTGKALKPVIWPGDSITVPKGWDFPVNGKILRIGVPVRREFKFFVNVENNPNTNTSSISGYSIDVFDAAVKKLPYALRYQYIPYDCANSYELLVSQVFLKNLDAAVGDVTIVANRTRYVDFTMPYTESGVSMLVLAKNDGKLSTWIFLEPLTKGLWIVTLLFLFATGLLVWLIEHPTNVEFQGSKLRQFSTVFYFTFSTLTFSHDQIIKKLRSKVLVVIWCFVVLVLVQTYTASLSSLLTARRLQPSVTDPWQLLRNGDCVGYQNGSFVQARLKQIGFGEHKIKVFSTLEQYANALRAGSKHGGVSAIFDEVPYLNSFLTQYGQEFKIVGPVDRTNGFGFVFPKGSPMVPDLSKAILNLREGSEGLEIENKWFGDATLPLHHDNPDTDFAHLTLRSFKGLFIINGITLGVTLLITLPKFIRARNTEPINASSQSAFESGETASNNEPEPLPDGTAEDSAPAESPPE